MQSAEQSCTALVIFLQYNLHPFILKNNSVDFTGKREEDIPRDYWKFPFPYVRLKEA